MGGGERRVGVGDGEGRILILGSDVTEFRKLSACIYVNCFYWRMLSMVAYPV